MDFHLNFAYPSERLVWFALVLHLFNIPELMASELIVLGPGRSTTVNSFFTTK